MESTVQEGMEYQAVAGGLCEAIVSVAQFEFTLEQWEVVEVDIRAAEDRESALIKELDKLRDQNTTAEENIEEDNELTVQDDTQCIDDILKDLGEALDEVEHQKASMTAAGPTEKTLDNAGDVFKNTVKNFDLNGVISKQTKKDKKRESRKLKKEKAIRMKIAKDEEKVVQLYFKAVDNIMKQYSKDVQVKHKKEEKKRKQLEKAEKKALKILEKEINKREKECVKNEKKKPAQTLDVKKKQNDIKKSKAKKVTGNNKDFEKKESHTVNEENAMKNRKPKKGEEKIIDKKEKDSQTMGTKKENIDRIDTTIDRKKNIFLANIRAFFRIFSCNKRQDKDTSVV